MTSNSWVLETVTKGYHIPLISNPVQHAPPHNPAFLPKTTQIVLEDKVKSLLQKQAIQHLPRAPLGFYSNMFMVPKKGGGQRSVINLKYLNKFVKSEHFKMEGLHTVKALLQKNDWMAKIDLKDAFFMVPIAPQFRKFLLFSVGLQTYQFRCLPFGLCTASRVFTKVLKPVVERLRSIGIHLVIYIDDMLLMAPSSTLLTEQVFATLFLLENTGFVINNKKSLLQPTQEIEFLGMIIDSVRMDLTLPGEKIEDIRQEAQKLFSLSSPSAHSLSQLAGKLNATTPALQVAPLFCRSLQTCLKQALAANSQDYKSPIHLSPQAAEDL